MATIGTFTASENGFTGMIKTLSLSIKVKFVASEKGGARLPHFRRLHRVRRGLEEDRPRQRSRISLGQARRSELPCADLCVAGQGRRGRRFYADLVAPRWRLIDAGSSALPLSRQGLFARPCGAVQERKGAFSFEEIAKGSALARARVEHETCRPGRSPRSSALLGGSGHEAGALSPWLHPELLRLGLPAICLETQHVRASTQSQAQIPRS